MPYLHLDLPATIPSREARIATRLCKVYAELMETHYGGRT